MYASAFDLRPQPGEMVVSRSDVKRRRKEGNAPEESIQGSPKRTKVHAQRKFAQGSSNMSSPALTPVKDKDKVKTNGMVLSPELIPTKRPKTEDFLTFLCFRGTPILPPSLDFFNVATVQEIPDEEQGSSLGECSRESTRNSRLASTSVGSSKLQRSTDRSVTETTTSSGAIKKFDRSESDGRRKPPTAVQALKRKYQEQRLAKQRASTLKKLAQKVKGKNMVRTRSSTHNKEVSPSTSAKPSKGNIVKKAVRSVNIVQRKIRSTEKPCLLTRMHTQRRTIMKSKNNRTTVNSIRRDGLRSGGQLPPGSEAGLKSERVLKQPEQPQQTQFKPVVKKKREKSTIKTFASSVSDFSSDDDQPLAKKMKGKPIENASSSRQLARKVIKRIVSKRMKPRMVTRSQQHQQQQQQPPEKEQTETRLYTRPPRKTKEAAAIYMELLGRKLITPEADVDEDSLSIDSFPELPNARRIERRESEIKARAYKERKEAQQSKEDAKGTVPQKSKLTADNTIDKRKQIEVAKAKKLSVRNRRLPLQKPEFSKNADKIKPSLVPKNLTKKVSVTMKENMASKKQEIRGVGLQMRQRKMSTRLQSVDNSFNEERETEVESNGGKLRPSCVPRRSLRRGSREAAQEVIVQDSCDAIQQGMDDIILPASNSGIPPAGTSSKNLSRKSKPMSSLSTSSPLMRIERNFSKSQENNLALSEETFSESDEEPLGKLALKHSTRKRHSGDVNLSKDIVAEQDSEAGKEKAEVVNRKVSKTEGKALLLASVDRKKENIVTVKAKQVLKKPMVPVHKGNEKKVQQPNADTSKAKAMELMDVIGTRNKELSQRRNDDYANIWNTESLLSNSEVDHATEGREKLSHRRSDVHNCKNKEKLLKVIDDDNNKNGEILQGKNEEISCIRNKELHSKNNDIVAESKDISNGKSEESEITKSSGMPPTGSDDVSHKNREVSCGMSEEETVNEEVSQRRTSECVNASYEETLLRRSDEFVRNIKDISLTEVEDEPYGKKKEISPTQSEVDLHSKRKEMVVESCEDLNAKWKKVSIRKSGDDLNNKTNEMSLKKDEEVCIKSTEMQLWTKDDSIKKKRAVPGRKFEDARSKNKEIETVNAEDVLNTKNGLQLQEIEETILSIENKVVTNSKSKELLIMKNEKSISKNIEAPQRNTEDRFNKSKQVLQRKCEDDTGARDREIVSKKSEDLGSMNEEILFGSGENCLKTVEVRHRQKEDTNTRMVEVPSVKKEDCFSGVEVSKSVREDRYLTQNTWLKSEYILAEEKNLGHSAKCAHSIADVEPLTKSKIITKAKELVDDVIGNREEKLESHKVINILNKVKNMNSRFRNKIMCSSKVDTAESSHVTKRNLLQFKTESQTVKTGKQTSSIVSSISKSNKTVQVANNVTVLNTERDLPNVQMSASDSILSEKNESILMSAETHVQSHLVSHAGINTSPKDALDDSTDSEQDVILRKLSEEQVCLLLSDRLSAKKEEPISKYPPNSVLPVSDTVLKQGSKTKTPFEDSPAKHLYRNENETGKVEIETTMTNHLPVVNRVGVTSMKGTAISKSDDKNRERCTNFRVVDVRRSESGPSSQALEFHAKSYVALNREPTFRDKVKAKVNMSNEQIEKWLNESYIDEADSKNLMFDKCIESISEEGGTSNTIDYVVSTGTKEHDYRTSSLEEVVKSGKGTTYLREIDDEHLYKPNKNSSFGRDSFQEKVTELPDVAPVGAESSAESLLIMDEGKCSRTNLNSISSLVKEPEPVGVGVIPISQQRIEVGSTINEKENQRDISKEETGIGKLQRDICSNLALQHLESELNMPGTSCTGTDRHRRCNEDNLTHTVQPDTAAEKINKLNSETKKQETNISHHSIKSHPVQDRGGEKKSIFQQRRSFPHKAKERKDLTPSANAFSPENESSVYAFDSEPELPPVSTPFRRRARDSRTSSTTTSKSEEDLARLDDEITPSPSAVQLTVQNVQSPAIQTVPSSQVQTVQSSVVQTVQSERLTLPVVGQPIQTLPLSTAIVQIIPTLPITMRPVQVENYLPAQQQQQQQLLLLQNDAVMTTLKTGCTSSTSIAVQVNLDNEPSLDASSQNLLASDLAAPEPQLQRSMECSTQTDVAEEEEDDSEGHLFYIPLQQPSGTGGPLAAPAQQLIQGVAVKLGTEGPTGPNQRVIMRAKLVTKPPTFNRTAVGIQDGSTVGIGRPVLTTQHQRPAGVLMTEQKNLYGSVVGASSTVATGTYPPVGTVQPTARGRPLVPPSNHKKSDDTIDTKPDNTDALKPSSTNSKTVDISSGLHAQSEVDSTVDKPLAMVSAELIDKAEQNTVPSFREQKSSVNQNALISSLPSDVVAPKLPTSKGSGNVGKEQRSSTEVNSPSTSSASKSTAGSSKRSSQKSKSTSYACKPSNSTSFPSLDRPAQMVEAPVFHPTEKEFQDPLEYIDRIRPVAEKFGLCRVVPPSNFKPECKVSDDMRFLAYNQYVHKMLHRWGPNVKEMMAIKKYLATQNISFNHPPWIGGMEVDLPRLYKIVQSFGGLKEVIEKKKWHRVADGMKIPKSAQDRVTKLDDIYCKYLLPYDTLSPDERQNLLDEMEKEWMEQEKRATSLSSPGGSDLPEEECDSDSSDESEECIVKGRNMPLNAFYRIARNTMSMWFRQAEPPASEVEQEFWRHVTLRQSHVCVHSGSIDSSGWGYGFPCSKNSPFARHPWNLKVLTNNSGSILRSIGPIMGVTVPTLHVGMLFTTCCWYRDPHGLPWVEYLHTGANKIWYGIPDEYSSVFRSALTKLVPRYCRNKTIWLPSDTAMVPPPMLVKHGVSLCHTVQEPGQFILVFPRAFTSSICTGYLVSESVYFAQPSWLNTAEQVFRDIQNSCEPSMFSLERLLFSISTDGRTNVEVLKQVLPMVLQIRQEELDCRKQLYALGLKTSERLPLPEVNIKRRKARQAREEEGDYECEICRANLFVSLVTNSHEEGVYCLPHAIELLTKKRHHLKYCKLMYTYDQAELNELIQKLQERIEAKSQRKSQGKHSTTSQKP